MVAALGDDVAAVDANVARRASIAAADAGTVVPGDGAQAAAVDGDPLARTRAVAAPAASPDSRATVGAGGCQHFQKQSHH